MITTFVVIFVIGLVLSAVGLGGALILTVL